MACDIFTDGWLLVILAACRYSSTAIVGEKCAVKLGEKQHVRRLKSDVLFIPARYLSKFYMPARAIEHNQCSAPLRVLYNPAYTDAYVFGRYKYKKKLDAAGLFRGYVARLPQDQWEVLIFDHHPGYISWSQYEDNLKQLERNRTNAEVSGPAREGWALLQGILLCGRCGCRMTVSYTDNGSIAPRYECRRRWENGLRATCSSLRCEPVDQVIEKKILDALQPAQLELALLALDKVLGREDEAEMSWKLVLERAQYEVDRAQRQYDLAEPENRLVTCSLEARYEKLVSLNNLHEEYDRYCVNRSWRPTLKDREDILALAKDMPRISMWIKQPVFCD